MLEIWIQILSCARDMVWQVRTNSDARQTKSSKQTIVEYGQHQQQTPKPWHRKLNMTQGWVVVWNPCWFTTWVSWWLLKGPSGLTKSSSLVLGSSSCKEESLGRIRSGGSDKEARQSRYTPSNPRVFKHRTREWGTSARATAAESVCGSHYFAFDTPPSTVFRRQCHSSLWIGHDLTREQSA